MTEDLLSKFTPEEKERLKRFKEKVQSGQKSEFLVERIGEIPPQLQEQAEDIRARIEARARGNEQRNDQFIKQLRMQMNSDNKGEIERIKLNITRGRDSSDNDGAVSITYLLIKQDKSEAQRIEARILRGGEFSVRKNVDYLDKLDERESYALIYPQPRRPEFGDEFEVLNDEKAKILLGQLEFLVDRCLTQPKLSFQPQRHTPSPSSLTDKVGS